MANIRAVAGSERLMAKLKKLIGERDFYEAHQLYRTLNFRLANSNKFDELRQLLFDGALTLFDAEQVNSAADLACLYLEAISKDKQFKDAESSEKDKALNNIGRLFTRLPAKSQDRLQFVATALKLDPSLINIAQLHHRFALALWQNEKSYVDARYHFLRSPPEASDECAQMLIESHIEGESDTPVEQFIAHFILNLVCMRSSIDLISEGSGSLEPAKIKSLAQIAGRSDRHRYACRVFEAFCAKHPRIRKDRQPFEQPLLNFLWFLLITIQSGDEEQYRTLSEQHSSALETLESFDKILLRIGQLYFGVKVQSKPSGFGGLFGSLIQSMMGDDSEDDIAPTTAVEKPSQPPSRQLEHDNDLD